MVLNIEQDHLRFREIVRGRIKQDLKKYISNSEMIGKKGKDFVSIPVPQIELPNFRFGSPQGGVGQGDEGELTGSGPAGNSPGDHILEVDLSMDELAQIMGEELELPRIEPRGTDRITTVKDKYSQVSRTGPESLRHFKRTYRQALRRQISSGTYNALNPTIVPVHEDKRFLSWKTKPRPESSALIVYMMDVSCSMGDEQKEIVRTTSFWIDTWIRAHYKGVQTRYIIHDAVAQEVDRDTFFHTRESGGTVISSAYELCGRIIEEEYPEDQWNVYVFHFSDGDNWSGGDTGRCVDLLKGSILPRVNLFGYGQVDSTYGSGQFVRELETVVAEEEKLITSCIENKDDIFKTIKDFLGKGM